MEYISYLLVQGELKILTCNFLELELISEMMRTRPMFSSDRSSWGQMLLTIRGKSLLILKKHRCFKSRTHIKATKNKAVVVPYIHFFHISQNLWKQGKCVIYQWNNKLKEKQKFNSLWTYLWNCSCTVIFLLIP